jgi:hypothetical protein
MLCVLCLRADYLQPDANAHGDHRAFAGAAFKDMPLTERSRSKNALFAHKSLSRAPKHAE